MFFKLKNDLQDASRFSNVAQRYAPRYKRENGFNINGGFIYELPFLLNDELKYQVVSHRKWSR